MRTATIGLVVAVAACSLAPPATAVPAVPTTPPKPACGFQMGFAEVRAVIPDVIGECVANEQPDANGTNQRTTKGLLVWRKADGLVAFTDGHRTWVRGPDGAIRSRLNEERFPFEAGSGRVVQAAPAIQAEAAAPTKPAPSPTVQPIAPVAAREPPKPAPLVPPTPRPAAPYGPSGGPAAPPVAVVTTPATVVGPTATVAVAAPADRQQGIRFGRLSVFDVGGLRILVVPVTNTTNLVKSFIVSGAYVAGDLVVASALGAVNDLLPATTRYVHLLESKPPPAIGGLVWRVEVASMRQEVVSTARSDAARKIAFGTPALSGQRVDVEVRNQGTSAHTVSIQAAAVQGEVALAIGSGKLTDLAAGQSKPVSIQLIGDPIGHTRIAVAVDLIE